MAVDPTEREDGNKDENEYPPLTIPPTDHIGGDSYPQVQVRDDIDS